MYSNMIISENLCGYINYDHDRFHTIWRAINLNVSLTIKIKNLSDKNITIKIENDDCHLIDIPAHSEQVITATDVNKLSLKCHDAFDKNISYGSYELMLHYCLNNCFNNSFKKRNDCDEIIWYPVNKKGGKRKC